MRYLKLVVPTMACLLTVGLMARAEDAPDAPKVEKAEKAEKAEKPAAKPKTPKLFGPWPKLATLTDEQKIKIDEIHKASLEEQKKIREKEEQDILAVLTPEQKAELAALAEKEKADRAAKEAEKKARDAEKKANEGAAAGKME